MSQWAVVYFTAFRNLKHILSLFFIHSELRRLAILFIIAITLTLFIADDRAVASRLFQSPASPPAQPAPAQQPPPTQPPPAQQPPAEQLPTETQSTDQSSTEPTVESSESTTEFESPVPEPLPEGSGPPPFIQPTVEAGGDSLEEEGDFVEDEEGSSNFILDRVELVDSVVVSGAYVWLCCGVLLLLLIPLFFLFLQIRGQIKIQREENY